MPSTRVNRAYRYRFYPTEQQENELLRTFGCVRLVYNKALEARRAAWARGERMTYAETSGLLTEWRRADELRFLREVSSVPLQQSLRHLQRVFTNFWAKRAGYPRFKSRRRNRSAAEYTRSAFRWRDGALKLAKMDKALSIVWSRPLPAGVEPSTVTVSRDSAGRWHVTLRVEVVIDHHPSASSEIAVDAGLTSLFTLSTGEKIANPRYAKRDQDRLAVAQRHLSRKLDGSANWYKARLRVARIHARIADRRHDLLHKLTTRLIRENQAIVIEDLCVTGMMRNRRLARAIADASWSRFRSMLEYKSAWYGRDLIIVDRWLPSSKTCSACGHRLGPLALNVRAWTCPACGARHDRDINAARNILAAGRAVTACGAGRRPTRHTSETHPAKSPVMGTEAGTLGREPDRESVFLREDG